MEARDRWVVGLLLVIWIERDSWPEVAIKKDHQPRSTIGLSCSVSTEVPPGLIKPGANTLQGQLVPIFSFTEWTELLQGQNCITEAQFLHGWSLGTSLRSVNALLLLGMTQQVAAL